ncbi:putative membrane protein YfcA [Tepidamorphus gemmatus]|uniref:Probable membrane transporter protein n=1 Tax=Tepidamorphus gemmatus TaxID=747076 RepID=A0A4R3MLY9_9HYPH|nr:sulfite exporter TauE/SafE family protein [Tepidamorphus gemmatus]TCT13470.1 putative membrane protein YfcA [Tepidamorphus gemmatus]
MQIVASNGELLALALALIASGAIAGVLAGMFGIGGGAVIVPVLYQFLLMLGIESGICMHVAIGTSLGIILPTSIRSYLAHKARGAVDMELLRSWVVPVVIGVVIGSLVANYVSSAALQGIFAAIAVVIGLRLIVGIGSMRLGPDIPGQPWRSVIGVVIGVLSTLMGVGGGVLNNTVMTLYGRTIHQAVATSSGLGVIIAIPGTIGFAWAGWGNPGLPPFSAGYVNVLGVLLVMPVTLIVAPIGVRIAHALDKRKLEAGFGIFLLIVAARFIWDLI